MREKLYSCYLKFRSPRVFLVALPTFVVTSIALHYLRGYDSDWGGTNLTLSIEASIASAVITVAADETVKLLRRVVAALAAQDQVLGVLKEMSERQEKTLRGVLLIAEAQRDALIALQEKHDER